MYIACVCVLYIEDGREVEREREREREREGERIVKRERQLYSIGVCILVSSLYH